VDSTPRAYRLKAGNAGLRISTSYGTFPLASAAPSAAFASTDLYVSTSGYVGINTTSPSYWLDALGSTTSNVGRLSSSSTDSTNLLLNNTTTGGQSWYAGTVGSSNPAGENPGAFHIGRSGVGTFLGITTSGEVDIPNNLVVTGTATLGNGSTAVTQTAGDNSTKIATDAFVANAIAGAGGMVLLATVNASGSSSVTFGSSYITSTYNKYVVEADNITGNNGGGGGTNHLVMQASTDNGSTWKTTNYDEFIYYANTSGTFSTLHNSGDASGGLSLMPSFTFAVTSGNTSSLSVKFSNPSSAKVQHFDWEFNGFSNSAGGDVDVFSKGFSQWQSNTAINAIGFFPTSGTVSGNFHLYGLQGT
jgi:hypothetical protein